MSRMPEELTGAASEPQPTIRRLLCLVAAVAAVSFLIGMGTSFFVATIRAFPIQRVIASGLLGTAVYRVLGMGLLAAAFFFPMVIGTVAGQLCATFRAQQRWIRIWMGVISAQFAIYAYCGFHGVANGLSPSPALSPDSLASYVGVRVATDGTFRSIICALFLIWTFVASVKAAIASKSRIYFSSSELPVLRRELTELANRRRTYIVRIVGAAVILLMVVDRYHVEMASQMQRRGVFGFGGPTQFLGIGKKIFESVVPELFATFFDA